MPSHEELELKLGESVRLTGWKAGVVILAIIGAMMAGPAIIVAYALTGSCSAPVVPSNLQAALGGG